LPAAQQVANASEIKFIGKSEMQNLKARFHLWHAFLKFDFVIHKKCGQRQNVFRKEFAILKISFALFSLNFFSC